MKTVLIVGGAALAVYLVWKYAPGGAETPCGCHSTTAPLDSASMTIDAAASTTFGPPRTSGLLAPSVTLVRPGIAPRPFALTLRSVIAAEDAPQAALPTPNTDTFASSSGQPSVDGTLPGQINPPAPIGARLRLIA
jgi:hypothetical protein